MRHLKNDVLEIRKTVKIEKSLLYLFLQIIKIYFTLYSWSRNVVCLYVAKVDVISTVKLSILIGNMCLPYQSGGLGGPCLFQQPVEMGPPAHFLPPIVRSQQVWEVEILFWIKRNSREGWIISHGWVPKPILRLSRQWREKVRTQECPCIRTGEGGTCKV